MRDDSERPGPLALSILSAATVAELKADASELAKLYADLDEHQRARLLVLFFGSEVLTYGCIS